MCINLVIKTSSKSSVAVACFLPGRAKESSIPLWVKYEESGEWQPDILGDSQPQADKTHQAGISAYRDSLTRSVLVSTIRWQLIVTAFAQGYSPRLNQLH
jgi:hypothetical protein